jgi:hypothetical protein
MTTMNNKEKLYLAKLAARDYSTHLDTPAKQTAVASKLVDNLAEDKTQDAGSFLHNRSRSSLLTGNNRRNPKLSGTFNKERNLTDQLTQKGMGNPAAEADIIRSNMLMDDAESSHANKTMIAADRKAFENGINKIKKTQGPL